jgi:hypothetical protein
VTKSEWIAIAEVLAGLRAAVVESWPPKAGYMTNAPATHDRKLIHFAKLEVVDQFVTTMAAALDRLSSNFDLHHFMRLVRGRG